MPARSDFVLTAVLSVFLFTLIKESGQNLSEQAECLHVCGLARQERSNTGVQVRSKTFVRLFHILTARCLHNEPFMQLLLFVIDVMSTRILTHQQNSLRIYLE